LHVEVVEVVGVLVIRQIVDVGESLIFVPAKLPLNFNLALAAL
jgi:hypothetical protein